MSNRRCPAVRGRLARSPAVLATLALGALIAGCQPGAAPVRGAEPTPSLVVAGVETTSQPGGGADRTPTSEQDGSPGRGGTPGQSGPSASASPRPAGTPSAGAATPEDCHQVGGFDVCGPIYRRYAQLGGPTGSLGRPVGEARSAGGGRSQRFEHGTVADSPSTGTHVVAGPAADAWAENGGAGGRLGYPLLDPRPAVGAESVSYFQGGAVFVTGGETDVHEAPGGEVPAVDVPSVHGLPLADFVTVRRAWAAYPPAGDLVWATDGCSGPTPPAVDTLFADPCLRHDFGYRNYLNGPRVDPTQERRLAVDNQFLVDLRATCVAAGEPQVNWFGVMMPCQRAAQVMYDAVRAFG
ncbi:LGFP repeat protein [Frankia sp. EI5c]|uniref:phospholipase A2 n=1 Tax=Frankia sp. EI5c TaxID=683316 RepID=UPI0007C38292|nr:phospholipase A2 [Frankia sp. EI5c]OAA29580.1 LGFP repeat protein [Frankia sp. EI5c]